MIPKRLIRTVPETTTSEVEDWWAQACLVHSEWKHITLRDPIDRSDFPITSRYWDACESGAQLADLIRVEELLLRGGVYIDSDVEVHRSFNPLLHNRGFAAWEDSDHIPNAVMGFEPVHPALGEVLGLALKRQDQGTWASGVGVTTEVFKDRTDMLVLPPGAFYPVHYKHKALIPTYTSEPWTFCLHHWRHSWA